MSAKSRPKVLTIAGSDCSGGAGIQADLKTIMAHRCYGSSVIVALTAQNTYGVQGIQTVPPDFVREQLDSVLTDVGCDAAKTGMLSSAELIEAVAEKLALYAVPNLVVDPVMISKSGHRLLENTAMQAMKSRLIPMARLVTPNAHEAGALLGRDVRSVAEAQQAAIDLGANFGPRAVLVKGGHLEGVEETCDVLWQPGGMRLFRGPRLDVKHTHGTGCTLSAAIASNLAMQMPMEAAIEAARDWLVGAMRHAFEIGGGISPVDHLWEQP